MADASMNLDMTAPVMDLPAMDMNTDMDMNMNMNMNMGTNMDMDLSSLP